MQNLQGQNCCSGTSWLKKQEYAYSGRGMKDFPDIIECRISLYLHLHALTTLPAGNDTSAR
jgi:hypothetical protein